MNDNISNENLELTKKQKADIAARDVTEVAARAAGRYYGGPAGGAAVDFALNTKRGQKAVGTVSKGLNRNFITRSVLSKNQEKIGHAKPFVNSVMGSMGGTSSGNESSSFMSPFNKSDVNSDFLDDSYDDNYSTSDSKSFLKVKLWKKISFKTKLIIAGGILGLFFMLVFIVVMITPLIHLGIIDIG